MKCSRKVQRVWTARVTGSLSVSVCDWLDGRNCKREEKTASENNTCLHYIQTHIQREEVHRKHTATATSHDFDILRHVIYLQNDPMRNEEWLLCSWLGVEEPGTTSSSLMTFVFDVTVFPLIIISRWPQASHSTEKAFYDFSKSESESVAFFSEERKGASVERKQQTCLLPPPPVPDVTRVMCSLVRRAANVIFRITTTCSWRTNRAGVLCLIWWNPFISLSHTPRFSIRKTLW